MTHPLIELGGSGPLVHLAPANGFPPATYVPMLQPVLAHHRVVSLPPRAMWPGIGEPPDAPGSWAELSEDLLAGLAEHRLPPVLGMGHSFGAVVSLLAAVEQPARFRALVLLDPTIPPPAFMQAYLEARRRGDLTFRPLAEGARKRRDRFGDAAEAFGYWRGKSLFADWSDAALRTYVEAMLAPDPDGGFTLTWSPRWEAHYYESFFAETWEVLDRLDPAMPLLIVGGGTSDTFVPEAARLLQERLPHAVMRTIEGHGHLFPQSAPEQTGSLVAEWLSGLNGTAPPPR